MTPYRAREASSLISKALKSMPVIVLSGMRQAGKSTLLQHLPHHSGRKYYSFDDYNILEAARNDPESFVNTAEPVTIDEAQKLPEILSVIKRAVDRNRRPGQFILSSSANFLLLKNVAESLAGRAVYLTLYPFSRREILGRTGEEPAMIRFIEHGTFQERDVKPIKEQEILTGGMPSICLGEVEEPQIWFRGYEQTYLERDIRSLSQVADLVSFRHILKLLSLRNAQILKQSEIARDAKLNVMTTSRYLALLEASFVLFRLQPHLSNKSSRLIKSPKIYFSDTGLAAYLAGVKKLDFNEALRGALFENYIAQNLLAIFSSHHPDVHMGYWNIQGRFEVDFILEIGRETIAMEIKYGTRWGENDLKGLKAYLGSSKNCRAGLLVYNGTEILKLGDKLWAVPASVVLS